MIQPRLHATSVRDGRSATLFVPKRRKAEHRGCRVIRLTPLFKELLNTATSHVSGSLRFRRALFALIDELRKNERETFALPCMQLPSSPGLMRAVEFLLANLDSVSVTELARQAGMSERSLRRHFQAETGISVSGYLGRARMIAEQAAPGGQGGQWVAGAPAYVDGLVIVGLSGARSPIDRNDGRLVALDTKTGTVKWACLTGTAQIAICWLQLFEITGKQTYRETAFLANRFLRRTVHTGEPAETRGAVKGSFPVDGGYNPYEYPNWAAKFLIDSLILEHEIRQRQSV